MVNKIEEIAELRPPEPIQKMLKILNYLGEIFNGSRIKGLKILIPNQTLSRLPISLAQLKAENSSEKLKNEIRQLLYSLYRSNKLTKQLDLIWFYLKMETIFMNTENSKTNEPHRFKLNLTDKLNLKNRNKNMALANLIIYYTWKNISQNTTTINLKFLHQFGMILLIYQVVLTPFLIFKIILNLLLKNIKL